MSRLGVITEKGNIYVEMDYAQDENGTKYRYRLYKKWSDQPHAVAIMMNPSKATLVESDNTVTNITNFFYNKGFGSLTILNLFAYMNTDSDELVKLNEKYESENITFIEEEIIKADEILVGWGLPKNYNKDIRPMMRQKIKLVEKILSKTPYKDKVRSFQGKGSKGLHPVIIRSSYKYEKHFE